MRDIKTIELSFNNTNDKHYNHSLTKDTAVDDIEEIFEDIGLSAAETDDLLMYMESFDNFTTEASSISVIVAKKLCALRNVSNKLLLVSSETLTISIQ